MEPDTRKGDLAIVRPQPAVLAGSLVAVRMDSWVALRWIVDRKGVLHLATADPKQRPVPLGKREILGRVITVIRTF